MSIPFATVVDQLERLIVSGDKEVTNTVIEAEIVRDGLDRSWKLFDKTGKITFTVTLQDKGT